MDAQTYINFYISKSIKFISKSIRPRLSKKGNVVVVVIVVVVIVAILQYLGLCREATLAPPERYLTSLIVKVVAFKKS